MREEERGGGGVSKGLGSADLLVSMCSQELGPEVQAVDSLPAVHLPEGILGAHGQGPAQQHGQLANGGEGLLVAGPHVQPKHLHHAAAHEVDVGHAGRIHKLGILNKAAVHALHTQVTFTA